MKTLLNFYKAYNQWIGSDAPEGEPFSRKRGLCWNLIYIYGDDFDNLYEEMYSQFENAGLDVVTPFDNSNYAYMKSSKNSACHLNEKRVQWVKDKLKEGESK